MILLDTLFGQLKVYSVITNGITAKNTLMIANAKSAENIFKKVVDKYKSAILEL